ncbi:MAG: molybdenum cofactor biosynthesis protein MoaE, partial [Gemmataceae bacterium]
MIRLTFDPIDYSSLTESVRRPSSGAVVLFLGTVRDWTDGHQTNALEYEAYLPMAEKTLRQVEAEIRERWEIGELAIVHRLGHLEISEISVAIALSCPHRKEAFAAAQFAMDRIKEIAPIWKKDIPSTGQAT